MGAFRDALTEALAAPPIALPASETEEFQPYIDEFLGVQLAIIRDRSMILFCAQSADDAIEAALFPHQALAMKAALVRHVTAPLNGVACNE